MSDEDTRELFARIAERNDYYDWLGLRPVEVTEGRVVVELPFDEHLTVPRTVGTGAVHGGVLATLVDVSAIAAVLAERDDLTTVATTDLDVTFHDRVRETVTAEAGVTGVDDGTASATVVVTPKSGDEAVARGEVTCRLPRD